MEQQPKKILQIFEIAAASALVVVVVALFSLFIGNLVYKTEDVAHCVLVRNVHAQILSLSHDESVPVRYGSLRGQTTKHLRGSVRLDDGSVVPYDGACLFCECHPGDSALASVAIGGFSHRVLFVGEISECSDDERGVNR